ncbi:hypothetical protein KAS14_05510 [Candidatus Bathyarchaeota archaeon]|nr:hypothetical protein [Candidatus Bathyarchaeota archaeon]
MGELRVIGRSPIVMVGDIVEGDLKLTWRKGNADEIDVAENIFKEYIKKGWLAIGEGSGKKKQIFTFNPDLEKITLTPLFMGG